VTVKPGSTFVAGKPAIVLKIPAGASLGYDVGRDGRFLFQLSLAPIGEEALREGIIVVQNWFEELKARVPTHAGK
jgi:hypothetical protein